jgi:hypothetical protein
MIHINFCKKTTKQTHGRVFVRRSGGVGGLKPPPSPRSAGQKRARALLLSSIAATAIQLSTRGTVGSHNWSFQLIETSLAETLPCATDEG